MRSMPIDTIDCCKMVGNATLDIFLSICRSNFAYSPDSIPSSFFFNTINDSTADRACAISVAQAAPATPSFKLLTKYISSPIFTKDENIRKYSGFLESPSALNTDVKALYKNKKKKP